MNPTNEMLQCPGGAIGACQVDHSRNKGYNLGYVQSNPQIAENGDLTLQYSGGSACHGQFNRSMRIFFSCSKKMVGFYPFLKKKTKQNKTKQKTAGFKRPTKLIYFY